MKIVKTYKEALPKARLIGKKYTAQDSVDGIFAGRWGEWFAQGWFGQLESLGAIEENGDAYLGAIPLGAAEREYWIGMMFPPGTQAPEGFEACELDAMTMATCWVYGSENGGELYGPEVFGLCAGAIKELGLEIKMEGWCIERYNCPRFTDPDDQGNVILDYLFAVAD